MSAPIQTPEQTAVSDDREYVVQTSELRKAYRTGFWLNKKVESLRGCTLAVKRGETFGLLGPNGAGKTTLLKILLGLTRPSSGQARLMGKAPGDREVKQYIGYLPENTYLYDYLTGWEFLELIGGLFGLTRADLRQRIPHLLDRVKLDEKTARNKKMRQYSKGMLQRIGMAQALLNDPQIVFLDEPMSGLDPLGRFQIRQIVESLKARGTTVFFNSHVLSDVEQICDRFGILARGELICTGSLDELLGSASDFQVAGTGGEPSQLDPWVANLTFQPSGRWSGQLRGNPDEFLVRLREMGAQLLELRRARVSLEAFFLQQIRDRQLETSQ